MNGRSDRTVERAPPNHGRREVDDDDGDKVAPRPMLSLGYPVEVRGLLQKVDQKGGIVTMAVRISHTLRLPRELVRELGGLVGKEIGILRLDSSTYRVRSGSRILRVDVEETEPRTGLWVWAADEIGE